MENGFMFAGKKSTDFHLLVEHYPAQKSPARKRSTVSIPGRNGDLHYDEGAYANYEQVYVCGFRGCRPVPEQAHAIKNWLLFSGAYQRLEDVYDPDCFRMASFAGPMDIENQLNKIGKCVITFDCKPQSFLKSGDYPQRLTAPTTLHNDGFTALPIIKVYGAGDGTVTVGDITVKLFALEDTITLDCEMQDAYRDVGGVLENMNLHIYAPKFPTLPPGDCAVSWSGGVERLEIIPRWWTV